MALNPTGSDVDDPLFSHQWGIKRVRFPQVWNSLAAHPFQRTNVAVIDTGMDTSHRDLPAPTLFEAFGDQLVDLHGHGTSVCGILCAKRNNGIGIAGAVECNLHVYRVVGKNGWNERAYYAALFRLSSDNIQVANLSCGSAELDPTEQLLLSTGMKRGIIFVAASGNHQRQGNPIMYPAATDGVIAVGATNDDDEINSKSSTGNHLFISAPGQCLRTTTLHHDYKDVYGTSFAAPIVTAAIATALSLRPNLSPDALRAALAESADKAGRPGWTPEFGHGILNVESFIAIVLR